MVGTSDRIAAGYGAMFGLLLLLTTMSIALDARFSCPHVECRGFGRLDGRNWTLFPASAWSPFFDNPAEHWMDGRNEPACPAPAASVPNVVLDRAPLPAAFDAAADPEAPLYACVRLDRRGRVDAVRLLRSTGSDRMDARLSRSITRDWHFRIDWSVDRGAQWHRVRLNQGPVSGSFPHFFRE